MLGRVPLFYFIIHFYAAHITADVLALLRYGRAAFGFMFYSHADLRRTARIISFRLWI